MERRIAYFLILCRICITPCRIPIIGTLLISPSPSLGWLRLGKLRLQILWYTSLFFVIFTGWQSTKAYGASELSAALSSTETTENENVSLEITLTADREIEEVSQPTYESKGLEELNAYSGSTGIESNYINGVFSVKRTQSWIFVLHPQKTGNLKIQNIKITVDGKIIKANDVELTVYSQGNNPQVKQPKSPPYFQQRQQQSPMPSPGVRPAPNQGGTFFIKTEPNKLKAYKGEQIILTYALYTRVSILGVHVERYPTVPGFLKEDLDIPLLTMRLQYSPAVVNGQQYNRAVLAQYAVYPIKEGKLVADALTGKFSYRASRSFGIDDEDPFRMFQQFFHSMQAQTQSRSSDRVTIEVLSLPAQDQPQNFSGLVGDFNISATADKSTLKAGESLNVKVKIQGKGHAGSLERLNIQWPQDFELYEDKSNTTFAKTGYSERQFDYMLIPKVKGKFQVPPIELSMFNPESKAYEMRKTETIHVEVLEGSLGNVYVSQKASSPSQSATQDIRYWMENEPSKNTSLLKIASQTLALTSVAFALLSLWSLKTNENYNKTRLKTREMLFKRAKKLQNARLTSEDLYAQVEDILSQALTHSHGIELGSTTRPILKTLLLEKGLSKQVVEELESLLERCENHRFMPAGGFSARARTAGEFAQSSSAADAQRIAQELSPLLNKIFIG